VGRPPVCWRLTGAGLEQLPRRYDRLAVELLEDLHEEGGEDLVVAVLTRRGEKVAEDYRRSLAGHDDLGDRVEHLAGLRDEAGYLAEHATGPDGTELLIENNCAVHRAAERFPAVCAAELDLLARCMGPGVEVSRVAHAIAGDAVCRYRIAPTGQHPVGGGDDGC